MKNRSSILIVAILIVLSGVSIYLYKTKNASSTLDADARNFKIEDTASITKIFMADKQGRSVTLEKKNGGWIVNGKYPARQDGISTLLYTMKFVDVKSPVSKNARTNTIKLMTGRSTKVEVYSGGELIKQYYVGHENPSSEGTYMILTNLETGENFDDPFLTHIPGFVGFLSIRYFIDEADWRDRTVINYIPPNISSIKMQMAEKADSAFIIKLNSTTDFQLTKLNGQALPFDEGKMKQYLAYFQNLSYEKLLTKASPRLVDSLSTAAPYATLTITDKKGETKVFNFKLKYSTYELNKKYGVEYKYDPDRLYLQFNDDKETALVQFYVFGKIMQKYGYFLPNAPVKK